MDLEPYYTEENKFIGQINLLDGLVDVTDPCYERGAWCALFDLKVLPGKYNCFIDIANFPWENEFYGSGDDKRIMSLTILHDSYGNNLQDVLPNFCDMEIAEIGVDAGLCGFYNHKSDFTEDEDWDKFWQTLSESGNNTCDVKPNGVTVSSGFGDGGYPLYKLLNNNDEIVGLRLDFSDGIMDR